MERTLTLIGHHKQKAFFKNALDAGNLSHAYIFAGMEGCGKKLFAKELARALLCEEGRFFEDCACSSCRQIKETGHPDLYLFEKEELKIETVRQVAEISGMTSYSGKWKIIIFDDAHLLATAGADAANALLKSLEEPGEKTVFFLITHRLDRMIATIQSRCLTINFDPLSEDELYYVLEELGAADKGVPYAHGSVQAAILLADMDIPALKAALDKTDKKAVAKIVLGFQDKEKLRAAVNFLIHYYTDRIKEEQKAETVSLIQYLNHFKKDLDYNVNINLSVLALSVQLNDYLS